MAEGRPRGGPAAPPPRGDAGDWLRAQGLGRYAAAFAAEAVGLDVLPDLAEADLEKLGVLLGDRKRLLRAAASVRGTPPPAATERRQLSVLFIDLVGSTALAARLDPEELDEVLRACHGAIEAEVVRHGGHLAGVQGDGALAYFGFPRAAEDDAERAVRAGLAAVAAVGRLPAAGGGPLAARAGVATGIVVVGETVTGGAPHEASAAGATVNLAARIQGLAEPGGVVVADRTRRIAGGRFRYEALGASPLKGFAKPERVWRVTGPAGPRGRFEALHGSSQTPLTGRERELAFLVERWREAAAGLGGRPGGVVSIVGEAGIGKSRIVRALRQAVGVGARTVLRYQASAHHAGSPLWPVAEQIERAARITRRADPGAAGADLARLAALLARGTPDPDPAAVAVVADLLGLPAAGAGRPAADDRRGPGDRKGETFAALLAQLEGLAARGPLLVILEDAHWLDPTSLELFGLAAGRIRGRLPALLVVTARPGPAPSSWAGEPGDARLALERLDGRHALAIAEAVAGGRRLPPDVARLILDRADGVPLFVEELTKAALEAGLLDPDGAGRLDSAANLPLAIPATLHDSLAARLDRLAPVKEVAQIGAVIGREFPHALLAEVSGLDEAELADAVARLIDAGLVVARGRGPTALYEFRHALVQDAAYASLVRGRRQVFHARVARVLKERWPDAAAARPELLARHCAEAGLVDEAAGHLLAAAERALRASANTEAVGHLAECIRLSAAPPPTAARMRREVRAQTMLAPALLALRGGGATAARDAYRRAADLCRELGEEGERFKIVSGLWLHHTARAETREARLHRDELSRLAEADGSVDLRLQAHHAAWGSLTFEGRFTEARRHVEGGLKLYDRARHGSHALTYLGHDPAVCARSQGAVSLWFLGHPTRAGVEAARAVRAAARAGHVPTLAHALHFYAFCHQLRRDAARVERATLRLAALAEEHGLASYRALALVARGWLLAARDRPGEALDEVRRGAEACLALDMRMMEPYHAALLAEANARLGRRERARELLEGALRFAEETGVRFWEAELIRLLGCLSPRGEAEDRYLKAMEVAARQGARAIELRAATSLARAWRSGPGGAGAAVELLAPLHGRLAAEGSTVPDMAEARALIEELRAARPASAAVASVAVRVYA